jgi:hypothetical protein
MKSTAFKAFKGILDGLRLGSFKLVLGIASAVRRGVYLGLL